MRKTYLLTIGFIFLLSFLQAQTSTDSLYLDIANIQTSASLDKYCQFALIKRDSVSEKDIPFLNISQKIPPAYEGSIPIQGIKGTVLIRFTLFNSSDTSMQCYFFPGLYCKKLAIYASPVNGVANDIRKVTNNSSDPDTQPGYVLLQLKPKEKIQYTVSIDFVLTEQSKLLPKIVSKDFISYFKTTQLSHKVTLNVFNYITAGILLMMMIYAVSVYFQDYQIEFLCYAIYAFSIALLFFLKSYLYGTASTFNSYFEGGFDFLLQMVGYSFYILFIRKFLGTKTDHPQLDKVLFFSKWIIFIGTAMFLGFAYGTDRADLTHLVENVTKYSLLAISVIFVLYGLWKLDPLMNYLVAGQLLLTLFSIISFLLVISDFRFSRTPNDPVNDPLLYYQIGIIFELVFFMSGLTYKNRRNLTERIKERERFKLDNERKEFEKQVAVLEAKQQERNRISADMHDELGSGVTAIRLMSEIVKTKMGANTLPEIEKISHSANELLGKMNTIIWTMMSSNDTVESLVAYIRAYAVEFFENTNIECHFNMPAYIPPIDLSGEKRRNIFLSVKEALNNVVKHSQATMVTVNIMATDKLLIEISDNGIGIDMEQLRKFGNGLNNMKKRIASISGEFRMENHSGTKTIFLLDFA